MTARVRVAEKDAIKSTRLHSEVTIRAWVSGDVPCVALRCVSAPFSLVFSAVWGTLSSSLLATTHTHTTSSLTPSPFHTQSSTCIDNHSDEMNALRHAMGCVGARGHEQQGWKASVVKPPLANFCFTRSCLLLRFTMF
jgi:hypothetical protein